MMYFINMINPTDLTKLTELMLPVAEIVQIQRISDHRHYFDVLMNIKYQMPLLDTRYCMCRTYIEEFRAE